MTVGKDDAKIFADMVVCLANRRKLTEKLLEPGVPIVTQ